MKHFDFFKYDLNLIIALDALFEERSVTRAAARVGITQSAMSQALRRLREALKDDLFIRTSTGIEPTNAAVALAAPLREALEQIHATLINRPTFDPASAERVFSLSMPDALQLPLMPALVSAVARAAPAVTLRTVQFERLRVDRQLDEGDVDIAIGRFEAPDARHLVANLYEERHVCVFNPRLVKLKLPLQLDDYLRYPHVLLAFAGDTTGVVDEHLEQRRRKRRVIATTPYAHVLPFVLEQAAAIGIVPSRLADRCAAFARLTITDPPLKLKPYTICMKWHARQHGDSGLQWLRDLVATISADAVTVTPVSKRAIRQKRRLSTGTR